MRLGWALTLLDDCYVVRGSIARDEFELALTLGPYLALGILFGGWRVSRDLFPLGILSMGPFEIFRGIDVSCILF